MNNVYGKLQEAKSAKRNFSEILGKIIRVFTPLSIYNYFQCNCTVKPATCLRGHLSITVPSRPL